MFKNTKKQEEQNLSALVDTLKLKGQSMNWLAQIMAYDETGGAKSDILTHDKTEMVKCEKVSWILIYDETEGTECGRSADILIYEEM